MSIRLKDTIYDLVNRASNDGSGNTITSTYLKKSGGTMTFTSINDFILKKTGNLIPVIAFQGPTSSDDSTNIKYGYLGFNGADNPVFGKLNSDRSAVSVYYSLIHSGNYTSYVSAKDHTHKYAGSDSVGGAANTVKCTSSTENNTRPIIVTNESNALHYTSKAKLNYSTGRITVGAVTITDTGAIEHIKFSRAGINYISLPESGSLAIVPEGQSPASATSDMIITDGCIFPGTTNVTDLGKSSFKWKNIYATTFTGSLSGNASSSTYATYIRVTSTNPTSENSYRPIWVANSAATNNGTSNYTPRANDGFGYNTLEGTTSALGYGILILGNSTASGTAGNKYGMIRLYSGSSGYLNIRPGTESTSSYNLYLPSASGQFVYHTNDTKIGDTATPVYITSGGAATACTITAGSANANRSLMVTNNNGMYYTPTITGNYATGDLISTVSDTTSVRHTCSNSNGAVSILTSTNRGLYDTTNGAWIIYLTKAADHVYVSKWASKGSSTAPVYFNSSGEPVAGRTYAGGTKVTLNGTAKGASTASFYAPTKAGESGQYLVSTGGVPSWKTINPYDANVSRTANTVLAAPNGSDGTASFRKLVAADIPNISAAKITSGTLAVARGGTGKTTLKDACNSLINSLSTGSSNPVDEDYYVSQYAGGGTSTTTYHRRPVSALYNYIKGKLDSVYADKSHNHSYLPLIGGDVSGHIYLTGSNTSSSTSNTSQLVFGTSSTNHVCISSNNNVLVINPTTSTTTNQIALYLDSKSQFPSGINVGSLSIGGEAITFIT